VRADIWALAFHSPLKSILCSPAEHSNAGISLWQTFGLSPGVTTLVRATNYLPTVAWIEHSEIRVFSLFSNKNPDFAALNPGYANTQLFTSSARRWASASILGI
jgi:hypothetical protein